MPKPIASGMASADETRPPAMSERSELDLTEDIRDRISMVAESAALPGHRLLHRADKLLQRERLRQERELLALGQALFERLLGIARDEDDLQSRVALAKLLQERRPIHLRHHHVGHDE